MKKKAEPKQKVGSAPSIKKYNSDKEEVPTIGKKKKKSKKG